MVSNGLLLMVYMSGLFELVGKVIVYKSWIIKTLFIFCDIEF